MQIEIIKYAYPKTIVGTQTIEIDDKNITYLQGRSGGSNYVACIIPNWHPQIGDVYGDFVQVGEYLSSFTFISCTEKREARVNISLYNMKDDIWLNSELKHLPHGEDIKNFFTDDGEKYNHRLCTKEFFDEQIKKWRII